MHQSVVPASPSFSPTSMSLFGSAQTDNASSSMANQTTTVQAQVTLVGERTVFDGTVRVEEDFRTDGRIIGTLKVEGKAMIAEQGTVEGDITATDAEIAGRVEGKIQVEECLVLKSTARIDGKIETDRLIIEEGAQFSGECMMDTTVSESAGATGESGQQNGKVPQAESDAAHAGSNGEKVPEEAAVAKPPAVNDTAQT